MQGHKVRLLQKRAEIHTARSMGRKDTPDRRTQSSVNEGLSCRGPQLRSNKPRGQSAHQPDNAQSFACELSAHRLSQSAFF